MLLEDEGDQLERQDVKMSQKELEKYFLTFRKNICLNPEFDNNLVDSSLHKIKADWMKESLAYQPIETKYAQITKEGKPYKTKKAYEKAHNFIKKTIGAG